MSGDDSSSYAPKSPDFSSYFSRPAAAVEAPPQLSLNTPSNHHQHQHQEPQHLHKTPTPLPQFHQQPPHRHQQQSPPYSANPYQATHASPYNYPHSTFAPNSSSPYAPPPIPTTFKSEYGPYSPAQSLSAHPQYIAPSHPGYTSQQPNFPASPYGHPYPAQGPYPPVHAPRAQHHPPQSHVPVQPQYHQLQPVGPVGNFPPPAAPPQQQSYTQTPAAEMPPRRAAAAAAAELQAPPAPSVLDPSPVRTKFPTARIKRIMQADEEVGKVAQQTPIAVGKALELFMVQLVQKSADVAKEKGSKRVTASMLKQVVETDDQWDFLRDIVSRVEHEKEGSKSKTKAESESEEETPEPKKKGRGGRKKKAAD